MSITPEILRKLSAVNLSAKQMTLVLGVIADVVAEYKEHEKEIIIGYQQAIEGYRNKEEEKKKKDADRKRKSRECPRTVTGQSQDSHSDTGVTSSDTPPLNGFPHPSLNPSPKNPPIGGQKRGSRLEIQTLPENWKAYCQTKRPDLDPHTTFEKFSNHWISKAGRDAIKLDWYRTWQNWVMNENQQKTAILVRTEPKKAGVITL